MNRCKLLSRLLLVNKKHFWSTIVLAEGPRPSGSVTRREECLLFIFYVEPPIFFMRVAYVHSLMAAAASQTHSVPCAPSGQFFFCNLVLLENDFYNWTLREP